MSVVLVTGGAGYIGSHTCKLLAGMGHVPVVLDNLSTGHRWAARYGPLHVGDIKDPHVVRDVVREHGISEVIHFAAKAYVGESVNNPRKYFRENVANTIHLLDTLLDCGVRRVIFSSTCATYGTPSALPISEDEVQKPQNPYGESKLFVERMLRAYGEAYGLQWIALRYFNAAGADPEGDLGEDHAPETHLIPCAIQAAQGQRRYLEIFGTDYPTPDGTAIRDYTHVADLARAHVSSMEYLSQGGESTAFNLGRGCGDSVMDVVRTVGVVSGVKVPVRLRDRRAGDPAELVADPRKAKRVLGWEAEFRDLRPIVATAWRWYSQAAGAGQAAAGD